MILKIEGTYTDSQKHESTLLHTYVLNGFLTADRSCTTKYFEKTVTEVGSSHLYAFLYMNSRLSKIRSVHTYGAR